MVFIFGGAYQGKTDFAREAFSLAEGDIFSCSGTEIDFSRRCVDHIENFTLACAEVATEITVPQGVLVVEETQVAKHAEHVLHSFTNYGMSGCSG